MKKDKFPVKMPIEYETACKALVACTTIDEAKYWSDKSEALEAWSRIHKSDTAFVAARRLKLFAFRRIGELAEELRPTKRGRGVATITRGSLPGAQSLLIEKGFSQGEAIAALHLKRQTKQKFDEILNLPKPPTPLVASIKFFRNQSENWAVLKAGSGIVSFRSFCRSHPATALARGLLPDEASSARLMGLEISEWLDEFDRHLPKTPKK